MMNDEGEWVFLIFDFRLGEARGRQDEVIRKILEHCGLWHDPPPRVPPPAALRAVCDMAESDCANRVEMDGDFLEHLQHEFMSDQLELPWEP